MHRAVFGGFALLSYHALENRVHIVPHPGCRDECERVLTEVGQSPFALLDFD